MSFYMEEVGLELFTLFCSSTDHHIHVVVIHGCIIGSVHGAGAHLCDIHYEAKVIAKTLEVGSFILFWLVAQKVVAEKQ